MDKKFDLAAFMSGRNESESEKIYENEDGFMAICEIVERI